MADKIIKFYHGASTGIQGKIDDGTINESDIVITADTDEIIYITVFIFSMVVLV